MFLVRLVRMAPSLMNPPCFAKKDQFVMMALIITALTIGVTIALKTVPIVFMTNTTFGTTMSLVSVVKLKLGLMALTSLVMPSLFVLPALITMKVIICVTLAQIIAITVQPTVQMLSTMECLAIVAMMSLGSTQRNKAALQEPTVKETLITTKQKILASSVLIIVQNAIMMIPIQETTLSLVSHVEMMVGILLRPVVVK
jgi:hypothetical protein